MREKDVKNLLKTTYFYKGDCRITGIMYMELSDDMPKGGTAEAKMKLVVDDKVMETDEQKNGIIWQLSKMIQQIIEKMS